MRSEFEFINDLKSRYHLEKVGDDCAVLPRDDKTDLLITSDMLVEGVDFRLEWATPDQIGHKTLAVSLSDIAAMGGTPTYAMLSIALAENLWKTDFIDRFYAGWYKLARKYGLELAGGDISRTSGPLVIDSIVLGEVPKGRAILRSGATAGDAIFVTDVLGRAAAGLKLLAANKRTSSEYAEVTVLRQLEPMPQISMGIYLRKKGLASAMIDLSDGLSSDLFHLCQASHVGAEIFRDLLPISPALHELFGPKVCLDMGLNGGEDFELLFTSRNEVIATDDVDFVPQDSFTKIGRTTANAGLIELIDGDSRSELRPGGFQHFSSENPVDSK